MNIVDEKRGHLKTNNVEVLLHVAVIALHHTF